MAGPDKRKFKPGDPLNPYDPASLSLGNEGVFDRIKAGQSPFNWMDPALFSDPAKFSALMAFMKKTIPEDAEELERTGETIVQQMTREKAEWAAQDAQAASLKEQGNAAFTQGNYKEAFLIYSACVELSPPEPLYPLNRAAAGLQLKLYKEVEEDAGDVLKRSSGSAKGYYRRAQARKCLGNLDEAAEDLRRAKELQPKDSSIEAEFAEVARLQALSARELEAWVADQHAATIEDIFSSRDNAQEQVNVILNRKA